jgi:hypothetical protein
MSDLNLEGLREEIILQIFRRRASISAYIPYRLSPRGEASLENLALVATKANQADVGWVERIHPTVRALSRRFS